MSFRKILALVITTLLTLTLGVVDATGFGCRDGVRVTDFGADPYGVDDSAEGVQAPSSTPRP